MIKGDFTLVVAGHREAMSPESTTTLRVWIPRLRQKAHPGNDERLD
jgi:hypothetical protein